MGCIISSWGPKDGRNEYGYMTLPSRGVKPRPPLGPQSVYECCRLRAPNGGGMNMAA